MGQRRKLKHKPTGFERESLERERARQAQLFGLTLPEFCDDYPKPKPPKGPTRSLEEIEADYAEMMEYIKETRPDLYEEYQRRHRDREGRLLKPVAPGYND